MMDAARHARLRRRFYVERINTRAAKRDVHHDAVHDARKTDRFVRAGARVGPTLLGPPKDLDPSRLRKARIFEMLRTHYRSWVMPLRVYGDRGRTTRAAAVLRLETMPGEQVQRSVEPRAAGLCRGQTGDMGAGIGSYFDVEILDRSAGRRRGQRIRGLGNFADLRQLRLWWLAPNGA